MGNAPSNWPPSSYGEEAQALVRAQARAAGELARLEAHALRMMDALYEAGFRIRVFKGEKCGLGGWAGWGGRDIGCAVMTHSNPAGYVRDCSCMHHLSQPRAHPSTTLQLIPLQTTAACAPTASGAWGAWRACSRASWHSWMWRAATGEY